MNKKQFADKYCTKCGTQRCEGVNSDWVDGCGHWEREMGGLNLVEKAMDNKGIMQPNSLEANCLFNDYIIEYNNKRNTDALDELLIEGVACSFLPSGGFSITTLKTFNFESMNEEVEC